MSIKLRPLKSGIDIKIDGEDYLLLKASNIVGVV